MAKLANEQFTRTAKLVEQDVASRSQLDRARAERDAKRAVVKSLEVAYSHRAQLQRVETSDREVRLCIRVGESHCEQVEYFLITLEQRQLTSLVESQNTIAAHDQAQVFAEGLVDCQQFAAGFAFEGFD